MGCLLNANFKKFDTDNSGYITVDNLREVLGDSFEGDTVEKLLNEADQLHDKRISYAEFVSYLRGDPLPHHQDVTAKIVDKVLQEGDAMEHRGSWSKAAGMLRPKSRTSFGSIDAVRGSTNPAAVSSKTEPAAFKQCCIIS